MKRAEVTFLKATTTHPLVARVYLCLIERTDYSTGLVKPILGRLASAASYDPPPKSSHKPVTVTVNQVRKILTGLEKAGLLTKVAEGDMKTGTPAAYKMLYHGLNQQEHDQEHGKTQTKQGLEALTGTPTGTQAEHDQEHEAEHEQTQQQQGFQAIQEHDQEHEQEHYLLDTNNNNSNKATVTQLPVTPKEIPIDPFEIITGTKLKFDAEFDRIAREDVQYTPEPAVMSVIWAKFAGHYRAKEMTRVSWEGLWIKWVGNEKMQEIRKATHGQPHGKSNPSPRKGNPTHADVAQQVREQALAHTTGKPTTW